MRSKGATVRQAIALLSNPAFQAAVAAFHEPVAAVADSGEDAGQLIGAIWREKREAFKATWGVAPPPGTLLERDERFNEAAALLAGRWGVIRVFPWTTERDVMAELKTIRTNTGRHDRRLGPEPRHDELAAWLDESGFDAVDIARVVWGRTKGLKPRTRKLTFEGEQKLVQKVLAATGGKYSAAERQAKRAAKDSEAPAAAMVRMAVARNREARSDAAAERHNPQMAEPISACLMRILRTRYLNFLPLVGVPAIETVAAPLDPLIDELRRLLLSPPANTK